VDGGRKVWILAKLPDYIKVARDDLVEKYLLLYNTHDGTGAVRMKFTPIRVVCRNTLIAALKGGDDIKVTHTRSMKDRLAKAKDLLGIVRSGYEEIQAAMQQMARYQMTQAALERFISEALPYPEPPRDKSRMDRWERQKARIDQQRKKALCLFENGKGNDLPGIRRTLWAAYNSVVELIDYYPEDAGRLATWDDRHLKSVWFGSGARTKARAYSVALRMMEHWAN